MGPGGYGGALELVTQVLELSDERFRTEGRESDFRPDAVKYIAISFSDISDFTDRTPVQVAEDWFRRSGAYDWEWDVYVELGEVLSSQARFTEAIEVYEKL